MVFSLFEYLVQKKQNKKKPNNFISPAVVGRQLTFCQSAQPLNCIAIAFRDSILIFGKLQKKRHNFLSNKHREIKNISLHNILLLHFNIIQCCKQN